MEKRIWIFAFIAFIMVETAISHSHEDEYETEEDIAQQVGCLLHKQDSKYVTYGSTVRLMNMDTQFL